MSSISINIAKLMFTHRDSDFVKRCGEEIWQEGSVH